MDFEFFSYKSMVLGFLVLCVVDGLPRINFSQNRVFLFYCAGFIRMIKLPSGHSADA
jgi:hypothetical protein